MSTFVPNHETVTTNEVPGVVKFAAENIVAGQWVYLDSDGDAKLAYNANSAVETNVFGVAINNAYASQPVSIVRAGLVWTGDISAPPDLFEIEGRLLVLSDTPGAAMDVADLTTDQYLTILGWSTATDQMMVSIQYTGLLYATESS